MKHAPIPAALLACALLARAAQAPAPVPVLVELFTSEGCSSCPPADRLLAALDRQQPVPGARILALGEHVDYWNSQGWTDPFSSAVWTARQTRYAPRLDAQGAYTPQMVIDGAVSFVGSDSRRALQEIARAALAPKFPLTLAAALAQGAVTVSIDVPAAPSRARVLVALLRPSASSSVTAGENSGRTLSHAGVALSLTSAGSLKPNQPFSRQLSIPLAGVGPLRALVFLQDPKTLRILGAAESSL